MRKTLVLLPLVLFLAAISQTQTYLNAFSIVGNFWPFALEERGIIDMGGLEIFLHTGGPGLTMSWWWYRHGAGQAANAWEQYTRDENACRAQYHMGFSSCDAN